MNEAMLKSDYVDPLIKFLAELTTEQGKELANRITLVTYFSRDLLARIAASAKICESYLSRKPITEHETETLNTTLHIIAEETATLNRLYTHLQNAVKQYVA